jgi:dolichyl-phosphate-mannose--protein O-mannosyl transferase
MSFFLETSQLLLQDSTFGTDPERVAESSTNWVPWTWSNIRTLIHTVDFSSSSLSAELFCILKPVNWWFSRTLVASLMGLLIMKVS